MKQTKKILIVEEEQLKQSEEPAGSTDSNEKPDNSDTTITVDGNTGEEKSDLKVDDKKAQDTNISVGNDVAADAEKSISELLVNAGWKKQENGTFTKDDFSDQFSAGISIDIQESKGFERFAQQLIFEATGEINLTVKVKNKNTGKENSFTHTFNADQIKNADSIHEIINKFIKEKASNNSESAETNKIIKADFFKAWEKLSEDEQNAFIEFYGDKLATLLQQQD